PVLGQRLRDEPVVGGVGGRGEQSPVEADDPGLGVVLVLVATPAGDLDEDLDLRCHRAMIRPRGAHCQSGRTPAVGEGTVVPPAPVHPAVPVRVGRILPATLAPWSSAGSPGCPRTSSRSSTV